MEHLHFHACPHLIKQCQILVKVTTPIVDMTVDVDNYFEVEGTDCGRRRCVPIGVWWIVVYEYEPSSKQERSGVDCTT